MPKAKIVNKFGDLIDFPNVDSFTMKGEYIALERTVDGAGGSKISQTVGLLHLPAVIQIVTDEDEAE